MQQVSEEVQWKTTLKILLILTLPISMLIALALSENEFLPTRSVTGVIVEKAERMVWVSGAGVAWGQDLGGWSHRGSLRVLTDSEKMLQWDGFIASVGYQTWNALEIGQRISVEYSIGRFSGAVKIRRIWNA